MVNIINSPAINAADLVDPTPWWGSSLFIIIWSFFNFFLVASFIMLVVWYVKQVFEHRRQVQTKLDLIVSLLECNKTYRDK